MLREACVLQHVEQSGLSGVVETQEEDLGILVIETEPAENIEEPIEQEHCAPKKTINCHRKPR